MDWDFLKQLPRHMDNSFSITKARIGTDTNYSKRMRRWLHAKMLVSMFRFVKIGAGDKTPASVNKGKIIFAGQTVASISLYNDLIPNKNHLIIKSKITRS